MDPRGLGISPGQDGAVEDEERYFGASQPRLASELRSRFRRPRLCGITLYLATFTDIQLLLTLAGSLDTPIAVKGESSYTIA